nr:hypothetical protein GCM10020093_005350 [Planobispora longispora]
MIPEAGWDKAVRADLDNLPADVGGSQGRIEVPLPIDRPPTDAERNTAGLATAEWITADMAYRRAALERVGGFDERFPAPTGRTPTSRCACGRRATGWCAVNASPGTRSATTGSGPACASSGATPTTR